MSFNRCFFVGRLGKDPEIKSFDNGKMANFALAINETRNSPNGTKKEYTEWVKFNAFNKTAELIEQVLHKGDQVLVEGSLRSKKYTNKDGVELITTNVQVEKFKKLSTFVNKPEEGETEDDFSDVPM